MKSVELSDEAYAALTRLAAVKNLSPAALLATWLERAAARNSGDQLLFHLAGGDVASLPDPADRYLALLAWVAENHAADFADFIAHQASARRYLMLDAREINDLRQTHQARQISRTCYWAVMQIDHSTQMRFVRRLLEYIGCHDETIDEAIRVLSLPSPGIGTAGSPRQVA